MIAALLLAATFTRTMERVSTMDPAMARSLYDTRAIGLVYEAPLAVEYAARPYRLASAFCDLPAVSDDGLDYRFTVREERLAAGFDAADMVRALERLRDPATVSPNAWIMKDVGAVTATDSRTVSVRLKRRIGYFPWLMTMPAAAIVGKDGEGSGPYRLASWWKNHEMRFTAREPVPGGFDEVRYLVVDDVSTQWLMFLKGEIDLLGEISRDNWDAVVGNGEFGPMLHVMPTLEVAYVGVNMRDPVLGGNRKLRQALNAAFDYPAWERFYNGRIAECNGPVPPGVTGRVEERLPYAFDLALAKRLIAEAGYPGGIDPKTGRRLVLTLSIGRATQESREAGELMASFYERIGVKLELQFMIWDAFLKAVNEGRVQLYRMAWVGDYPDAQNFLQLFATENASPGANHGNYSNPEFDAAYAREDWQRCQEIVREDCPWIFTNFNKSYSLVRPRVGNYIPSDFPGGSERYYHLEAGR